MDSFMCSWEQALRQIPYIINGNSMFIHGLFGKPNRDPWERRIPIFIGNDVIVLGEVSTLFLYTG